MTHKTRGVDIEKCAYYVNKPCQNVGLETGKWCQIVMSQTEHTKYKWPPYDPQLTPPWKFSVYATVCHIKDGSAVLDSVQLVFLLACSW